MIIKNKLDKAFGPVGSTAGVFIFIVGIVAGFYSMGAILLIIAGAFIGFTSTSAIIDTEQKRVKLRSDYFGIIKTGKWIDIQAGMKIGIQKQQGSWRAYSRGNRKLDIPEKNFRIYLFGENNQKIIPLDKASFFQEALDKRNELSNELGLLTA